MKKISIITMASIVILSISNMHTHGKTASKYHNLSKSVRSSSDSSELPSIETMTTSIQQQQQQDQVLFEQKEKTSQVYKVNQSLVTQSESSSDCAKYNVDVKRLKIIEKNYEKVSHSNRCFQCWTTTALAIAAVSVFVWMVVFAIHVIRYKQPNPPMCVIYDAFTGTYKYPNATVVDNDQIANILANQ